MTKQIETVVKLADYENEKHASDVLDLLNGYAKDNMGGGEPLSQFTQSNLIKALQSRQNVFSVLVYVDGQPAGLSNCILSFSTFSAKDVVNIHDVFVAPEFRGMGICRLMFEFIEQYARDHECCKMTLEVLEGNEVAKQAYAKFGFSNYELDPSVGQALFWQRKL